MSLIVTGATGALGRLTIEHLLKRGVPATEIVATGRVVDRIGDLAERGVQIRFADYADPASLRAAFAGATRLLLVSGSVPGPQRVQQHRNAIEAASEAGAGLVAYTSIVNAATSTLRLAEDHQATEVVLRESGVPFTLLRNSWYTENYTAHLPTFLEHGAIYGSAGDGRVSAATRADYAAAAAAVLTTDGQENQAYELGGDEAFTLTELAAEITAQSGTYVRYVDLPEHEYATVLAANGLPQLHADTLADADRGLSRGELETGTGDLRRLLGQPATPLAEAIAAALPRLSKQDHVHGMTRC
jgi:NAD(P)H dehydrogenase (quinone)